MCVYVCAQLCTTLCTPLPMEFSRQEYWSGLPFHTPGDLSDPGIKSMSLVPSALAGKFFTTFTTSEAPLTHKQNAITNVFKLHKSQYKKPYKGFMLLLWFTMIKINFSSKCLH